MSLIGFVLQFFSFRHKVYILRKKYDRIREKADNERNATKRLSVLTILDQVESTLVILEEQKISRVDRGRMVAIIENGIRQATSVLNQKYTGTMPARQSSYGPQQQPRTYPRR